MPTIGGRRSVRESEPELEVKGGNRSNFLHNSSWAANRQEPGHGQLGRHGRQLWRDPAPSRPGTVANRHDAASGRPRSMSPTGPKWLRVQ
jgi:hypothetical protein